MSKVSPSMTSKPLMSPTEQTDTKTSRDLVADFSKMVADNQHVWSHPPAQQSVLHLELGAQAAFQPAFRVNLGQSQAEFINGKIQKILDRQKRELRLINDSFNLSYISNIEELKKIHDIEKLTHVSADLDDVPLTFISKDYLPIYLNCRKMLAELNHIKVQLDNKKKTLEDILDVSSITKDDSDNARSALKTSITAGIRTLNAYKTLSELNVNQNKSEKELEDLIKLSKDKKESADFESLAQKSPAFTNILDPGNIDPVFAQKSNKYQVLVECMDNYKLQITQLETKTRFDNDFDLSVKSIHMFAKAKARIQDEAKGCCNVM